MVYTIFRKNLRNLPDMAGFPGWGPTIYERLLSFLNIVQPGRNNTMGGQV